MALELAALEPSEDRRGGRVRIIAAHILDKIRSHSCHWSWLPLTSVPSAAVSDEDTGQWSAESYELDLRQADKP